MQAGPEDRVQKGIILCRGITSLVLSILTFIFMLAAIIGISVTYGNILMSDQACSLKAAFGMFVVATCCLCFLVIWDGISLCMMYYTKGCCHCECYHMNFSFQAASFGMILIGNIIIGSKDPDKVDWEFWLALTSAVMTLVNAIMWCMTQQMKRFIKGTGSGTGLGGGGLGGGFGGDLGGGLQPLGGI